MTLATGPLLEQLMRRLAETPADMLAEPAVGISTGTVETGAVVGDVYEVGGVEPSHAHVPKPPLTGKMFSDRRASR